MIELVRVVENQAALSSYRATQNEERAVQLELLIDATKPKMLYTEWHTLIATPFRYPPPHPNARFRPPYGRNVFYGSVFEETALYEHAFHFMKQRLHLAIKTQADQRTIFFVNANDNQTINIKSKENYLAIVDRNNYSASHDFIKSNSEATFVLYPSCRDPKQRDNAAILDINLLEKNPKWESAIKFFYDNERKKLTWIDYNNLHIEWAEVC